LLLTKLVINSYYIETQTTHQPIVLIILEITLIKVHFLMACKDEGVDFAPLVLDTFGGWTPEISHVISVIYKCPAGETAGKNDW
jgi:hypothetical protein